MKRSVWLIGPMALLAGMAVFGRAAPAFAAEGNDSDRLDRLEQRVNEIAQRQEQLMNWLGAGQGQRGQIGQPGVPGLQPPPAPAVAPPFTQPRAQVAELAKSVRGLLGLAFLAFLFCNILLTIWIFTDIRKRGEGPGIFVAMALVAGIPAAVIYGLTRIADKVADKKV